MTRAPQYRLTVDGGRTLKVGKLETIAIEISAALSLKSNKRVHVRSQHLGSQSQVVTFTSRTEATATSCLGDPVEIPEWGHYLLRVMQPPELKGNF